MILAGDFAPQKSEWVLPDFGDETVLCNLEGPLCREGLPKILKVGAHLHTLPGAFRGHWAFNLANNHIMDYTEKGLVATCEYLDSYGFPYCGAGCNQEEAHRPMWLEESGKKIAVIGCCEHQFGVSSDKAPGVAAIGEWIYDAIRDVRGKGADVVIVSSHAGSESTRFVSPRLRSLYHDWIDSGADVIHGHHAHVPQGYEIYKSRPIFYGLGNFIIDRSDWASNPDNRWSLIAYMDFNYSTPRCRVEYYGDVPPHADEYMEAAKAIFSDQELLVREWQKTAIEQYTRFYKPYITFSLKGVLSRLRNPHRHALLMQCFSSCENHIDIINTARGFSR